ncbi:hypothetical protein ACTXT7_015025 [Hymenolepis weldensis]
MFAKNVIYLAYDGPQAFEIGNPDLLDPPLRVNDRRIDKADSNSSIFGENCSNTNYTIRPKMLK